MLRLVSDDPPRLTEMDRRALAFAHHRRGHPGRMGYKRYTDLATARWPRP
jgi:hypothetical protein